MLRIVHEKTRKARKKNIRCRFLADGVIPCMHSHPFRHRPEQALVVIHTASFWQGCRNPGAGRWDSVLHKYLRDVSSFR